MAEILFYNRLAGTWIRATGTDELEGKMKKHRKERRQY